MLRKLTLLLISGVFVFGMSKLSFAMMCAEHSSHQQIAQAGLGEQAAGVTGQAAQKEAVNVGNKICPVTGEKIDEKTKVTYEYQGKIYNFCCPGCPDEFKKDPEKYIKKVEQELQSESKDQAGHKEHEMEMMQGSETMPQGMHQGHHH